MPGVVSNSTPLIYLAKIGKLDLLKVLFGEILIPKEVWAEVVEKGKSLGQKDAYAVENAVAQGWIKVVAADPFEMPIELDKARGRSFVPCKAAKFGRQCSLMKCPLVLRHVYWLNAQGNHFCFAYGSEAEENRV